MTTLLRASRRTRARRGGRGVQFGAIAIVASVLVAILGSQVPAAADGSSPPRIDLRVLVLTNSSSNADFEAWQAALKREGVPFDSIVVSATTNIAQSTLSTTASDGTPEAKYEAIIEAPGGLGLPSASAAALEDYQRSFNIRQVTSDVFPSAGVGMNAPTVSGPLDGITGTLTTAGQTVFPYLNASAPILMDAGTHGYQATPLETANFHPLVSGPNGSALAGIYVHPTGVQEMVLTFAQNQYQQRAHLLRHGILAWVTRGVFFGDQRNYLETHIDDVMNSDDVWNPATHTNDYSSSVQQSPADVASAVTWSAQSHFRIDNLFNGGGNATPALLAEYKKQKGAFGWVSHTWNHPNLDDGCATQPYIQSQIGQNLAWAQGTLGLTVTSDPAATLGAVDPGALVTGEHSGLANLVPGNPGTVDPPAIDSVTPSAGGGALPAGTYVYAVTDQFSVGGGESSASSSAPVAVTGATGSVTLTWSAVCHASDYNIYRGVVSGTSTSWTKLPAYTPAAGSSFTDAGASTLTYVDAGAAGTPVTAPPAVNTAVESPYQQNTSLPSAFAAAGIKTFGSDASKPYPNPPSATFPPGAYTGATFAAGGTFTQGAASAVPRYPTNIYYNAATAEQEIDEYNYIYLPPPAGICQPSATNTCLNAPVSSIGEIVQSVVSGGGGMFQHLMGNDPRPHYFHQSNMVGGAPGGLYFLVMDQLLAKYNSLFTVPIVQPTMAQLAELLARQASWSAAAQSVTGYIQGSQVTITNSGAAVDAPLSGVAAVGSDYGGTRSGWATIPTGTTTYPAQTPWPPAATVSVRLSPPQVVADGVSTTIAAATVKRDGAPAVGDAVSFTASDPGVKIGTVTGHPDGNYTATVTASVTAQQVTIIATDASVAPAATAQATLTQTALAPTDDAGTSPANNGQTSPTQTTPTQTTPSPPPAVDTTNPVVAIGPGPLSVLHGEVSVTLACPADQSYCAGTVTLKATTKGRTVTLGQSGVNIAGGHKRAVVIPVPDAKLRQFRPATSVPATISVTARDATGRTGSSSRAMKLVLTDRTNPRVAILGAGLTPRGAGAWIRLACPVNQSACAGTASVRTNQGGRNVVIAVTKLRIDGGRTKTVTVRFSKQFRVLLAHAVSTRAVIRVEVRNRAGKKGTSARAVTLRGPGQAASSGRSNRIVVPAPALLSTSIAP
jgi:Invasin, domain 3